MGAIPSPTEPLTNLLTVRPVDCDGNAINIAAFEVMIISSSRASSLWAVGGVATLSVERSPDGFLGSNQNTL